MKFLCALCFFCGSALSAAALDREAFTFTRYDLDVRIEPQLQRLGVRGKITLRNDSESPQKNLALQISSTLTWSSVQFEGKSLDFISQVYNSDVDHTGALSEAIVTLPHPVAPKQPVELQIGYEGVIPVDTTRLSRIGTPPSIALHSDWDQISPSFTAVRGIGYVAWYPIATEAASLSEGNSVFEAIERWKEREAQTQFEIDLCAPKAAPESADQTLPELLMNEPPHTEGRGGGFDGSVCSGHSYRPLGSIVPVFVIRDHTVLNRPALAIYYLAGQKSAAEDYALAADEVVPLIDEWFGKHSEMADLKADVVELPDPEAAPFESGNMLLTPIKVKDAALLLTSIHYLTRLAFPSPRDWIGSGVAGYAQLCLLQDRADRGAVVTYLQNHRAPLLEPGKREISGKPGAEATGNSLISSSDEFYVATKATNVWWMLRDLVGETALTAALHNYRASDDKRPDYMQKLIEQQSHRDLEWFFDDWVYRDRGLPDFRVVSVYPRALVAGGYMLTVTVENLGSPSAEVPVIVHTAQGEVSERLTVPGHSQASVRIQSATLPQEVTVNDGSVPETDTSNNTYKIESTNQQSDR